MRKKIIGYAAVDSGQLIVVDPCYLKEWKDGEYVAFSKDGDNHYAKCCEKTLSEDNGGEVLVSAIAGNGVAFSTGWGDGSYPVTAHYGEGDSEGRIMKITIDF